MFGSSTAQAGSGSVFGGGGGAFGSPQQQGGGADHRTALVALYQKRDPSKLVKVDEILKKYQGQEQKLWAILQKKYGQDAQPPAGFNTGGGGGA